MNRKAQVQIGSVVAAALVVAAPAFGQVPTDCRTPSKATREFVEAFSRAKNSLEAREYGDAIAFADLAKPSANDTLQRRALLQIQIASYAGLKDNTRLAPALETMLGTGCLQPAEAANYQNMLDNIRGVSPPQ
jgi:hypothetical protein